MTPLALFLRQMGYQVSGSDNQPFRMSGLLKEKGIQVFPDHRAEQVEKSQLVIYSTAIPSQNPEYQQAIQLNIRCINRLEAVSMLMSDQKMLSITGSYGKSTTTTFSVSFANQAGLNPSYLIGADLLDFSPAKWNRGATPWFVFETDESHPDYLHFTPYSCVLTNIGNDHLQNYQEKKENLEKALFGFITSIDPNGCIVLSQEAYHSLHQFHHCLPDRTIRCGTEEANHYRYAIEDCLFQNDHFETYFQLTVNGKTYSHLCLRMPGEKYVLDAVLAYALISESTGIFQSTDHFMHLPILDRRFQLKKQWGDSILIDDEGDSPDVILEVLRTAKKIFPEHTLVPVLQPHRFSRLKRLAKEYADALASLSDKIILLPVYSAGEDPIAGTDSSMLASQLSLIGFKGDIILAESHQASAEFIQEWKKDRCVFILLGPGDVWKVENAL